MSPSPPSVPEDGEKLPRRRSGSRSRSPARTQRTSKPSSKGFKWKQPSTSQRDRDRQRDSDRGRYDERDRNRFDDRERNRFDERDRTRYDARDRNRDRPLDSDRDRPSTSSRPYRSRSPPPRRARQPSPHSQRAAPKPARGGTRAAPASSPTEAMIIVHVNDRLGTKAAIPCLGSDTIRAFKAVVAAHIGRKPHEILLKRQGERPFKDQLTLADYEVGNGVQLDLEVETGD